jgi:hypothetical protein
LRRFASKGFKPTTLLGSARSSHPEPTSTQARDHQQLKPDDR